MLDIQSIIIYLGLALLSFVISKYAELSDSKKAVWLVVILLSLIAGLRGVSVGIDTKTYDSVFNLISMGAINGIYGMEKGFIYICAALLKIWSNTNFLLFIFAFISSGFVLFRIWKDRERISFSWSVLTYYILFYAFSLNGMRQFVAVAIVFFATSFVKEGKYVKFIIWTLIASLFHFSAIIGIAYLFFEIVFAKYFDVKRKIAVYFLVGIGVIVGVSIVSNLINRYSGYFDRQATSVGLMMVIKLVLLILSFLFIDIPLDKDERYYCFSHRWNYFLGIVLNSLSYIFLYMGRIGMYFYVFETIHIGYLFKSKNRTVWTVLFKIGYVFVLIYYLYNNITRGAQGEIPYKFFWQG